MTPISPESVYNDLQQLERVDIDVARGAFYRQLAQDILANPDVSLSWRQMIADRLSQANHLLAMRTVGRDDSY